MWLFLAAPGLRVGEVRALKASDFGLDAVPPHVQIPTGVAKSRREESVPLRSDLLPTLAARLAGKAPDDPAFVVPSDVGARFDRDRERAGVPKRDARGRTVDCHALCHTFGTSLAAGGVPVRVAMSLMRHSTSRLTESVYVDAALESTIPGRPLASQPKEETAAASVASLAPSVAKPNVIPGHFGASSGTAEAPDAPTKTAPGVA